MSVIPPFTLHCFTEATPGFKKEIHFPYAHLNVVLSLAAFCIPIHLILNNMLQERLAYNYLRLLLPAGFSLMTVIEVFNWLIVFVLC